MGHELAIWLEPQLQVDMVMEEESPMMDEKGAFKR